MELPEIEESRRPARVVIISGLSGSGKSTAIRALEDIGFFCIDNLQIVLLPKLIELFPRTTDEIEQIALVVDAREARFLDGFHENIDRIKSEGSRVEVMFLDCSDKVLIRRYNETRRRHPLAPESTVEEGISREREILKTLRQKADQVIDTSEFTLHQLRRIISEHFSQIQPGHEMNVVLVSFGFKYGIPSQADLVFDVRFLPNPYFVQELRGETGLSSQVASFVMDADEAGQLIEHVTEYLDKFRPHYDREGKSYLTVAIGCTGGRHRSVAIVEELSKRLRSDGCPLVIRHRDINRT